MSRIQKSVRWKFPQFYEELQFFKCIKSHKGSSHQQIAWSLKLQRDAIEIKLNRSITSMSRVEMFPELSESHNDSGYKYPITGPTQFVLLYLWRNYKVSVIKEFI